MSRPLQTYTGSCHCGAIRFEIDTDFPELTQCDCSICRKKNALMVKVHESAFRLLAGADALADYQFHTHTAHHHFCKLCGIYRSTASASPRTTTASTSTASTASTLPASRCG
ncbi:MAG: GFA family protein [Pseudoxanthomonas sp.]|nr:GFA family protein [Pseudoxanthomonas sp.]